MLAVVYDLQVWHHPPGGLLIMQVSTLRAVQDT